MPEVLKTPYKTCPRMFVFSIFIALWVKKKYPIKIIPACSTYVWWWKLEVQALLCIILHHVLLTLQHPSYHSEIHLFSISAHHFHYVLHFHSVVHSIYFKKLLPCLRRVECKSWAICAAFCGLKMWDTGFIAALKGELLALQKYLYSFLIFEIWEGKFAVGKFGGANMKQN